MISLFLFKKHLSTLNLLRHTAGIQEHGYFWENQLHKHTVNIPEGRRARVLKLAHDMGGHLGVKKMSDIIGCLYTWPGRSPNQFLNLSR